MSTDSAPTLAELIASLAREVTTLLHNELELAKAEAAEALQSLTAAARLMVISIIFGVGAAGVLLAALVNAATLVLVHLGLDQALAGAVAATAVGVTAAIAAALFAVFAFAHAQSAQERIKRGAASLATDAALFADRL
jgi:hypothetical protein